MKNKKNKGQAKETFFDGHFWSGVVFGALIWILVKLI